MPAQTSPTFLLAATRRRSGYADLRISDTERSEVADLLSKHYGDGRLDQDEFNERLDQAMKAKTYKDLNGLFDDLPRIEAAEASRGSRKASEISRSAARRRHPNLRVAFLVLVIVIAATAGHALAWSITPWVWIALLGAIVVLATRARRDAP